MHDHARGCTRSTRTLTNHASGAVWCGVVWCGVVWCGVVWCGVVWCGVVCRRRCYQKAKAGMSTHGFR